MVCRVSKPSDWVALAWTLLAVVFWIAAGYAASESLWDVTFACSVVPLAFLPAAGLIGLDLDRRG